MDESHLVKDNSKECILKFLSSPVEIVSYNSKVKSVRLKQNLLDNYTSDDAKIVKTSDDVEEIDCGIVIRSIGYKSTPIDDTLPFDHKRGVILNHNGRVFDNVGLYCSGWAAFGATGVILNTMNASFEVAKNIIDDIDTGKLDSNDEKLGYDRIQPLLKERNAKIVDFIDWQRIDEYERQLGQKEGKPREKIVSVEEILDIKDKS